MPAEPAVAAEILRGSDYAWLTATQRKEVLEALEAEIERRQPSDDLRTVAASIVYSLKAALDPSKLSATHVKGASASQRPP